MTALAHAPMTTLARELRGSYAFIERNVFLTRRYWGWEIAFLVYHIAGALSIAFIGVAMGDRQLLLSLMIGAIFWNYLAAVFSIIAEQVAWERWEGTLEYTMMAPVRRTSQLLGSTLFAVLYGLIHTAILLVVLTLFFGLDLTHANFGAAIGDHARGLAVGHRHLHDGRHPAAHLGREGRADDVRAAVPAAAGQRRVLQHQRPARLDAGPVEVLAGDLHPRGRPARPHRWRARSTRCGRTSGRC